MTGRAETPSDDPVDVPRPGDVPDHETAIIRLREHLGEARLLAWQLYRLVLATGAELRHPWGRQVPLPDWLTEHDHPVLGFVHVEGEDRPACESLEPEDRLAGALAQRDEARLWAWGHHHRMFEFPTSNPPLWLTATTLPADPEPLRRSYAEPPAHPAPATPRGAEDGG